MIRMLTLTVAAVAAVAAGPVLTGQAFASGPTRGTAKPAGNTWTGNYAGNTWTATRAASPHGRTWA